MKVIEVGGASRAEYQTRRRDDFLLCHFELAAQRSFYIACRDFYELLIFCALIVSLYTASPVHMSHDAWRCTVRFVQGSGVCLQCNINDFLEISFVFKLFLLVSNLALDLNCPMVPLSKSQAQNVHLFIAICGCVRCSCGERMYTHGSRAASCLRWAANRVRSGSD